MPFMGETSSLTKNSAHKASFYPSRRSILPSFFSVLSFVLLTIIFLSLVNALALPSNPGFIAASPSQKPVTTSTSGQSQTGGWIPVQGLVSCPPTQMAEECKKSQELSFVNQKTDEMRKPLPYVKCNVKDPLFEAGVLGGSCYDEGEADHSSPGNKECTEDGLSTGSYFDARPTAESPDDDNPEVCIYDVPRTCLPLCDDIEDIISDEGTSTDDDDDVEDEDNTVGSSKEGSE